MGRLARTVSGSTFPSRRAGWQLERGRAATGFLLRSLHRFSAFQVAGRRGVSLAFSARRRLVALHDLLLVVQEHAAQRPPDAACLRPRGGAWRVAAAPECRYWPSGRCRGAGCSSACWMPASNSSSLSSAKRSTSRRQRVTSCTTMISAFRRAGALPVAIACA